ncbi:LamB/YcsF family protein [Brevibacterium litoralis]|uniref:LamB/YcsF family protein n=1 Tax=Brevibacterium litoralis TaxID=3138935 RepID=UPI0032ED6777
MPTPTIDLNSDLGESFGGVSVGDDAAMLDLVSSANVACGFHAGDPHGIARTLRAAAARGVTVGAHPAYQDRVGFGRRFVDYDPAELADEVLYQVGAVDALARAAGTRVRYVKPHGALYNTIVHHEAHARAVVEGVRAFSPDLPLLLLPGAVAARFAQDAGLPVVREAFADRAYEPDGTLASRRSPGAVVTDPAAVRDRVVRMATEGTVLARDGSVVHLDTSSICIHGDSPGAVAMACEVRAALTEAGIRIEAFA